MDHQRVMLIRARPGTAEALRALDIASGWAERPGSDLVFFHGPGLGHAALGNASEFFALAPGGLDLRVCRAGWQRLDQGALPEPFAAGSLIQFWHAALSAREVQSFGAR